MITSFIKSALQSPLMQWEASSLSKVAAFHVPDDVIGRRNLLLRADIRNQWARWFVEGFIDPRRYMTDEISYAYLFKDVFGIVNNKFSEFTKDEKRKLASTVANIVQDMISNIRKRGSIRKTISKAERSLLVDISGNPCRCWICGAKFIDKSVDNFIYRRKENISLPMVALIIVSSS